MYIDIRRVIYVNENEKVNSSFLSYMIVLFVALDVLIKIDNLVPLLNSIINSSNLCNFDQVTLKSQKKWNNIKV